MSSLTNERPYLHIKSTRFPEQTLLHCVGEIDVGSADCLLKALSDAIMAGSSEVVVDLREVSFLDSAGIRALVKADAILRDRGRSLEALITPGTAKLFQLLHLEELLPVRVEDVLALQTVH